MKYIMLFTDALECMEPLSDAECGRLVRALLQYKRTKQTPELRGNERMLFPMFRAQIDRNEKSYGETCRKNSENAKRRWKEFDASACDRMPSDTTACDRIRTDANDANTKKKKNTNTPPISPKGESAEARVLPDIDAAQPKQEKDQEKNFETFWAAYPRKVGKQAALRAWKKVDAPVDALLTALAAQKKTGQWQRDGGQYIPYPATWLNGRRWEDEMQTEVEDVNDLPYFDRYQ